jgi:hypothetical protein
MNLFLGLAWLLLGVTVLAWQTLTGYTGLYLPGNLRISYGWVMFVLFLYNLKRWWSVRGMRRRQRQLEAELAAQERDRRKNEIRKAEQPPIPEFKFSDKPSPSPADGAGRPAASE